MEGRGRWGLLAATYCGGRAQLLLHSLDYPSHHIRPNFKECYFQNLRPYLHSGLVATCYERMPFKRHFMPGKQRIRELELCGKRI